MKTKLYNQTGEVVGDVDLNPNVFGLKMNEDLLHQAVTVLTANQRQVLAHTKDRSEVSGGGRKPWRQKGTGRARHGSTRSPIWIGGGTTFGPTKDRNFKKSLNKKMKQKALFVALSSKFNGGSLFVLDKIELPEIKTKKMAETLNVLAQKLDHDVNVSSLIVTSGVNETVVRSTRNIPKIEVTRAEDLNILDVLSRKNLIITQDAVKTIEAKNKKSVTKEEK